MRVRSILAVLFLILMVVTVVGADTPKFTEYRGVRIGMSADEVRAKLGEPKSKGPKQDLFAFSDNESAQIFYDKQQTVYAISVDFIGNANAAPAPVTILGEELTAKPDGSMYRMNQYPEAGCWVSYYRTSGDNPHITITIQKMRRR